MARRTLSSRNSKQNDVSITTSTPVSRPYDDILHVTGIPLFAMGGTGTLTCSADDT